MALIEIFSQLKTIKENATVIASEVAMLDVDHVSKRRLRLLWQYNEDIPQNCVYVRDIILSNLNTNGKSLTLAIIKHKLEKIHDLYQASNNTLRYLMNSMSNR